MAESYQRTLEYDTMNNSRGFQLAPCYLDWSSVGRNDRRGRRPRGTHLLGVTARPLRLGDDELCRHERARRLLLTALACRHLVRD